MSGTIYKPTIGLEVHAELRTQTKMFCACKNDPDEKRSNVNICPVCMAHPGTLPVINREAVKHVLAVGAAVGGKPADFTEFDRKNYFYPDIPKGYQISQYKSPLVAGGVLAGVQLTRIHLEEDTARSSHERGEGTLVDFNRAGVPLMELVTEPVVKSAEEAGMFARELQLLLRTLGVSEANMEKGEMRVEANISVSNTEQFGTKVEVKNLNSFRAVERAIAYEVERQSKLLDRGESVVQETRGWDETKGVTFSQRKKESAHDYRYFPDPDLPKLQLSEIKEFSLDTLRATMPELPWEKRERLVVDYGVKEETARMFVERIELGDFFEKTTALLADTKGYALAENYLTSDLVGMATEGDMFGKVTPENFAVLMGMITESKLSSRGAKEVLALLYKDGGEPEKIAQEKNLTQQSDKDTLTILAKKIIDENPTVVAEYRAGKESVLQFLLGQGMKLSRGGANPELLKETILEVINV